MKERSRAHPVASIAVALVLSYAWPPASIAGTSKDEDLDIVGISAVCGARSSGFGPPLDYRTAEFIGSTTDAQHTEIALEELRKPSPDGSVVLHNLNWALARSPNHYVALGGIVDWERSKRPMAGYPSTKCYLFWARQFVPDDLNTWLITGNYYYKKNDFRRARAWYQDALTKQPDSAEAHYALGLVLFEEGDFDDAMNHARQAYALGYPLPGLRRKLERVGQWDD